MGSSTKFCVSPERFRRSRGAKVRRAPEPKVLAYLVAHAGRIVPAEEVADYAGLGGSTRTATLASLILRINRKCQAFCLGRRAVQGGTEFYRVEPDTAKVLRAASQIMAGA